MRHEPVKFVFFYFYILSYCSPVKFVSSFIPLDAVQVVAVQIIAAHQICTVSGLIIRFDYFSPIQSR